MRVDQDTLPQESTERLRAAVAEHLERLGIEEVGIDGDGTIWRTPEVYAVAIREAVKILVDDSDNHDLICECDDYLRGAIRKMRNVYRVNPLIMEYSTLAVAVKLGRSFNDERVTTAIERVREIFSKDKFGLFDNAREVLVILGKPVMYTHAGEGWTRRKIDESEINDLLNGLICMEEDRTKSEQWREVLADRVDPKKFLVIGDNFKEDILVPLLMGARGVWIGKIERLWEMLADSELELFKDAVCRAIEEGKLGVAKNIASVPETLLGMR